MEPDDNGVVSQASAPADISSNNAPRAKRNWRKLPFLRLPRSRRTRILAAAVIVVVVVGGALLWWYLTHQEAPVTQPASAVSAEFKKQLPSLEKAVQQHPKDAEARKNYAVALYATGDPNGAKKQYEEAVKINPKDAVAYNNLGNVYRDLHQTDKAVDAYNASIKLNGKSINTYANLANVQLYIQNKPTDAIATYQKGLKALPNNAQLQLLLGLAYEANGNTTKAKQTYQTILAHNPKNAAAKANLNRLIGKK